MKIVKFFLFPIVLLIVSCSSKKKEAPISGDSFSKVTEKVMAANIEKTRNTASTLTNFDQYARNIPKTQTNWKMVGVNDWCSGFWPGVLWYTYEFSGDEAVRKEAEKFTEPIKPIAFSPAKNHDIGFMVFNSFGNGYRLTGNEEYKEVILAAADTLATLYNPNVGSILSWPSKLKEYQHNTIIDNMMNLELLFWAAKNGGSQNLYDIAQSHATVTMKNLVRKDSSLFHLASFDPDTGIFIKGRTHQGYSDESMWARGQTWGMYGFAVAYRETGESVFLDTSIKLTEHFLDRLPKDGIPYWDFDDPKIPDAPKDASAAAIAACAMLELSTLVKDDQQKQRYVDAAKELVTILSSEKYLSGETNEALLLHSTGHFPNNSEIDVPIIYADYYFMEALLRMEKMKEERKKNALAEL